MVQLANRYAGLKKHLYLTSVPIFGIFEKIFYE